MQNKRHIIIVAGGTGSRLGNSLPKQFVEINGKPIIVHTIKKFYEFDPNILVYVAVNEKYFIHLEKIIQHYFADKPISVTKGGDTRFHSVKNALELIKDVNGVVGIHDAARPMVSVETIRNCFETAEQKGNATPAIEMNESLRKVENGTNSAVNRSEYKIIQTPQCFKFNVIKKAFEQQYESVFTDDASVAEKAGTKIYLVEGNPENIKITYPSDLVIAEYYLK